MTASAAPSSPNPHQGLGHHFTKQQKAFTLVGTLLGLLLAALDQTIVATAGPAIQQDLKIEPSLYVWLTTSYLVASTVMVPIWGKLSDLVGRRTVLVSGILIFLVGSLLCGISQDTVQLILSRVLQGLGAGSLFTTAFAVIGDLFEPAERGKYAGMFGAVFGLSSVVGPLVGGFITDTFSWHWVFLVNVPVGAVALGVIFSRMPALKPAGRTRQPIDVAGAFVFALAVIPLLLALSLGKTVVRPGETGFLWASPQILGMFALSIVAIVVFIVVERRAADPLMDMKLFENRAYSLGNLATFVYGMAFLGAIVFLPLFMVNVVGLSATRAGLTTVPLTFGIVIGNIVGGQGSARTGRYKFIILGSMVLLIAGFLIMGLTITPESTQLSMTFRMVLVGLGLGPAIPLFSVHVQAAVQPHQIGAATSVSTLSRSLGSTMGLAIFGTVFATQLSHHMAENLAAATADVPPAFVAQLRGPPPAQNAAAEEGAPAVATFNKDEVRARVEGSFAARAATLDKALLGDAAATEAALADPQLDPTLRQALTGPPLPPERQAALRDGARRGLDVAKAAALATVDKVDRAMKEAFTQAIAAVYLFGVLFALAALLIVLVMPEQPLRRGPPGTAPPPALE